MSAATVRAACAGAMIALVLVVALAGCGKKGPPEPPEGEKLTYPRTYPTR